MEVKRLHPLISAYPELEGGDARRVQAGLDALMDASMPVTVRGRPVKWDTYRDVFVAWERYRAQGASTRAFAAAVADGRVPIPSWGDKHPVDDRDVLRTLRKAREWIAAVRD